MSFRYTKPLARLIDEFSKMPGIGPKTAQRLAFYILKNSSERVASLAKAILEAKEKVKHCSICGNITDQEVCEICQNINRDKSIICVVEKVRDLIAIENTGEYKGLYHVLEGAISPLDGIEPENLKIDSLLKRLKTEKIKEIILATNPNIEGEVTASYLNRLIEPLNIKVTRIAYGVPIGGSLEFADEVTLTQALMGRQKIK
ncbi:MAG: recombination protein RecR [bacterium]|uniref:Recombination protein RecR n=1 Tax=Candidatus Infernicultor aquiphilus TaxID=1805029 RepID=A0A2M8C9P3_9BACT|nr:recombination protein RecR [bacterium]PIU25858.1 MAG: recombination protein RecR [Candidatus Atribacteria bacterium CG08_land_8_20_14_0_20_33_29]PIW11373.1 MAG: recombination protein RecR [Candidatus Atribacteria bacterium CG17_big_fil_post_rev_8_21_14_2_50_34_11]PJB55785.1 MAG: recombination protein RecR [Candidatus Atribacteria bacterium CG_4_9_14_3_um_filter_33_16]